MNNKLANLAINERKPTKQQAQNLIASLAESAKPEDLKCYALLYTFFKPAAPKVAKTAFDWVAQAVSKDVTRPYLNYVYADGPAIVATDGYKLHTAPNVDGLPNGFYDSQGNKIELDANYPDWRRILPEEKNLVTMDKNKLEIAEGGKGGKQQAYKIGLADVGFNTKYLDQATLGEKTFDVYLCDGGFNPVVVRNKFGKAVIMPVNLKKWRQ